MNEERTKILQMIESGTITAEQGMALMGALGAEGDAQPQPEPSPPPSEPPPDLAMHWRHYWLYGVYVGVGLLIVGALFLYAIYASGSAWWGVCGWPTFAFGVLVTALAAWSRSARWLHVRVTGADHHVAISMPLPLKLAAWGLKIARRFVPKFEQTGIDEVVMGLGDSLDESGDPFYVDVHDDEEGEHVQVYIG